MRSQFIDLAQKYGTPLYVYDSKKIIDTYKRFVSAFDVKNLKVHYACKALSNLSILRLFKEMGSGLDCVSEHEVALCLRAGFSPEDIIFTPNGVSLEEYDRMAKLKTKITIDNIHVLEYFGIHHPNYPVYIRVNPHLMAGGNDKISVGHIDSKFGISIHQLPHILRLVKSLKINVEGVHIHTGSDIIDFDIFLRVADLIFSIVDQFPSISSINFGSGFKVKYRENDMDTNIDQFGHLFSTRFNEYCKRSKKELTLRFEPGKFMVSNAGFFISRVNLIKQTTSCTFVAIDSGFNHFIRPMLYDAYHEIENISNPKGKKKLYSVVGNICETDTFGNDRLTSEVRMGDFLLFKNAGAYCFEMSSNYNSRPRPAEVLIHKGKSYLIRERENFDDLLTRQKEVPIKQFISP